MMSEGAMKSTEPVEKMSVGLSVLHARASELEETASYAVALAEAVESAVNNIVGPELSEDCDKEACEAPKTIDSRLSSSNYVIMSQLKRIYSRLERL